MPALGGTVGSGGGGGTGGGTPTGTFFSTENAAAPATAPAAAGTQDLPTKGQSLDDDQGVLPLGMSLEQPLGSTATLSQLPFTGLALARRTAGDRVRRRRLRAAPRNSQRNLKLVSYGAVGVGRGPATEAGARNERRELRELRDERRKVDRQCLLDLVRQLDNGRNHLGRIDRR